MEQNSAKKLPVRQCLGCNEHKLKKDLVRIVRSPDGTISLDRTGKKSGRGAYICLSPDCLKKARKNRRIDHVLNCSIPDDIWVRIEKDLADHD